MCKHKQLVPCHRTTYGWGKKDSTKRYLWSKTILNTGSMGGPGIDPSPRKIDT